MELGTRGLGDVGRGDVGHENVRTQDVGRIGTRGLDKQTTHVFFAEFVKYNFRCSRERICWRACQ